MSASSQPLPLQISGGRILLGPERNDLLTSYAPVHSCFAPDIRISAMHWFFGGGIFFEELAVCGRRTSVFGASYARRTQHIAVHSDAEQRNFKQLFAALS